MSKAEKHPTEDRILRPVMPELDTVRGIAILMVFLFHGFEDFIPDAANVPAWERLFLSTMSLGWIGVNLFFVLSGFLITGILLDSVNQVTILFAFLLPSGVTHFAGLLFVDCCTHFVEQAEFCSSTYILGFCRAECHLSFQYHAVARSSERLFAALVAGS